MTIHKSLLGWVLLCFVLTAGAVLAQDEVPLGVWQKEIKVGVNVLQSSYSNNWNGGEKGSVVWTGNLDARFEKQFNEHNNWRNKLKLAYGQTLNQERNDQGVLVWQKPDKNDDIIDFESMYRRTSEGGWDPFVAVNYLSLFNDVSDIEGRSLAFNPMTFKESLGISRKFINTDERQLFSRLGVALIQNSRKFFPDAAPATNTESSSSNELAAEWVTEYNVGALDGRVDWESKLIFSAPFIYSGKSVFEDGFNSTVVLPADVADYTTTVDIDWENTFTANITKVISVSLYVRWVYDKYDNTVTPVVDGNGDLVNDADVAQAIRTGGQFKQTMALGLGYTFN